MGNRLTQTKVQCSIQSRKKHDDIFWLIWSSYVKIATINRLALSAPNPVNVNIKRNTRSILSMPKRATRSNDGFTVTSARARWRPATQIAVGWGRAGGGDGGARRGKTTCTGEARSKKGDLAGGMLGVFGHPAHRPTAPSQTWPKLYKSPRAAPRRHYRSLSPADNMAFKVGRVQCSAVQCSATAPTSSCGLQRWIPVDISC